MRDIKMLVMDVDGTLTDGKIYYGNDGEVFKAFDVRDGYRLIKCEQYGIITAIITGKSSKIVEGRAKDLKIREVYQGVSNKLEVLKTLTEKYGISFEQVAYIGDDVNDHVIIDELLTAMCNGTVTKEQYVRFAKIKNAQKIHKFIRDILYNHVYGKPKE